MKAYLRLTGGLCIGRKRSASSCQQSALSYRLPFKLQSIFIKEPSAVSSQLSDMARHIRAISRLKPKIYQLSAIGGQPSDTSRWVPAISKLIPKAYHLIPILILVFVSCGAVLAQEPVGHTAPAAQAESISGMVVSAETGEPLAGATVRIKNTNIVTSSNERGQFIIYRDSLAGVIEVSFLGYIPKETPFTATTHSMVVPLEANQGMLQEVEVNTGYQQIPKERATGSFVQIDNELLNRSVSSDIISRLKGIAPSLAFDERAGGEPKLSIRGRSTIFANDQPLIVLDNFPYEGDINNINPNDIENISILRDAAAASIWGVRAGNGVIVITTKKGRNNQPLQINFNANTTIGQKPDLFYEPRMASADFIEVERFLFDKGYFDSGLNNLLNPPPLSPAIEFLAQQREGLITAEEVNRKLGELGNLDVRDDVSKYFYRQSVNQQYALDLKGGSAKHHFYVSSGFDKNESHFVGNGSERFNISTNQYFNPSSNLSLELGLYYNQTNSEIDHTYNELTLDSRHLYPYAALADNNGQALSIPRGFRASFIEQQKELGLNWDFYPIEELGKRENEIKTNNIRLNSAVTYKLLDNLSFGLRYQFQKQLTNDHLLWPEDSYSMRDMYNRFSFGNDGGIRSSNIPEGALLFRGNSDLRAHNGRAQVNYLLKTHSSEFNVLGGLEVRENRIQGHNTQMYGYDVYTGTSQSVNYDMLYPTYPDGYRQGISSGQGIVSTIDLFRSYFANAAYSYRNRYTLSLSGRVDQSNLFGVAANQRAVPLWSAGALWNLSEESFFNIKPVSLLHLRTTYGVSGNLDNTITAFTTARYSINSYTRQLAATISTPPNPNLRWEKNAQLNISMEVGLFNNRVSASVDYYRRKGSDLIGNGPVDPTNGLASYRGNLADMEGSGWDIEVNTLNIKRKLRWQTAVLFSLESDKVTKYNLDPSSGYLFLDASLTPNRFYINPIMGKPLFSVYSYPWAGLNPENGNPQGYLDGEVSEDYSSLQDFLGMDDLVYHGRAQPSIFGAIRNDFSYKQLSLSFNITYKFGYYFRRRSIDYQSLFRSSISHHDYAIRWQNSGDEKHTDVPSFVYPANFLREEFYANAEALVAKGDHVRLQDIQVAYDLKNNSTKLLKNNQVQLYLYANNLGILWRANKQRLDPEISSVSMPGRFSILPLSRTIAAGIRVNL